VAEGEEARMGTRPPLNRKKKVNKGNKRTFCWNTLKSWLAGPILKKKEVPPAEALSPSL